MWASNALKVSGVEFLSLFLLTKELKGFRKVFEQSCFEACYGNDSTCYSLVSLGGFTHDF